MEKENTPHNDEEIYEASIGIALFLGAILSEPSSVYFSRKKAEQLEEKSEIYSLIKQREWNKLFSLQSWLSFLKLTQAMCAMHGATGITWTHLKIISDSFREETRGYIEPEFFPKQK